mmetsp:Transcript_14358/g.33160  ORF Transcript_14358/g.33160 Transcript_14358/m.33160 type:complete len:297 (+) Transcript_14358:172-1062(+)|eukprot:CAMPEP_0116834942 /NCGR_PEP_ID=MMETSP0418-20121206/7267_1 /TAXON_ID=1158023 /ORGANISM="Astrosyne radiata, Strain 13vi08-1A" /LENGTH=296 /DNA_ID=CAMNT_0004464549 /DNA_START=88 /DNA_END=978 /DNA_ORIENTATION=+
MSELTMPSGSNPHFGGGVSGGFSFENFHRNKMLEAASKEAGISLPTPRKTGTTIAGIVYKDGVVLGSDSRATLGGEIVEKNCKKIHHMASSIYCCGSGTAADCAKTAELIRSQLELLRMNTYSQPRVVTACTFLKRLLFKYHGHIRAGLILGGCDVNGPAIYEVHSHGSTSKVSFTADGSGSLAAITVFDQSYRAGMEEEEAVELVKRAILAGIFNDLGSGNECDLCVIRMDGTTDFTRGAVKPNDVQKLREGIPPNPKAVLKRGTTPVLKTEYTPFKKKDEKKEEDEGGVAAMET